MKMMPNKSPGDVIHKGPFEASDCVDVHCHCLPAMDDGPKNLAEAVTLCEALVADGITTVIATPHQLGRFDGCYSATEVRKAVADLNLSLKNRGIPLTVASGADVRVDERILQLLKSDRILTLADTGRYIMLELPHETFIDISSLLAELDSASVKSVISHPERNHILAREPDLILRWAEYTPCLQITAASLVGDFGQTIQSAAWHFLDMPFAVVVATDAHNTTSRSPRMAKAFEMIAINRGATEARKLCVSDPIRILKGQEILSPTSAKKQKAHQ